MNYNQMINLLANPNTGHMSEHRDHYDNHSTNHYRENQYQKPSNHQLLQRNHSLGSQMSSVQHYKIEEPSPKQTRNRTKFTDQQIEKLEGKFLIIIKNCKRGNQQKNASALILRCEPSKNQNHVIEFYQINRFHNQLNCRKFQKFHSDF